MDFADLIRKLAKRVSRQQEHIRTEEAAKTSFVLPFISALGYDIHDPKEVIPELTADTGVKKDEKVDYAIMNDGKPVILVECKKGRISFDKHGSQLYRYYAATDARFAILTNGVEYQFFADLRKPNVMDKSPFLIVNMLDLEEWQIDEICKFAKPSFDGNAIWKSVHSKEKNRKDMRTITDNIAREFASPSRKLVRLLAHGVLEKGYQKPAEWQRVTRLTKQALDQYSGKCSQATKHVIETSTSPLESEGG